MLACIELSVDRDSTESIFKKPLDLVERLFRFDFISDYRLTTILSGRNCATAGYWKVSTPVVGGEVGGSVVVYVPEICAASTVKVR